MPDTPIKKQSTSLAAPGLFKPRRSAKAMEEVTSLVQDALAAFASQCSLQEGALHHHHSTLTDEQLEAELEANPHLIVPYQSDDNDSDFTINVKKCRKPRTVRPKVAKGAPAPTDSAKAPAAGAKRTSKAKRL